MKNSKIAKNKILYADETKQSSMSKSLFWGHLIKEPSGFCIELYSYLKVSGNEVQNPSTIQ